MAKISRRQRNSSVQKQNREFDVRPLTKAVRVALAVSVSALALTMAPQPARAANPGAPGCVYNPGNITEYCNGFSLTETLTHGFVGTPNDLTMVVGNSSNTNIVNPPWWAPDGIDAMWNNDVRVELGSYGYIHAGDGRGIVAGTGPTFAGYYDAAVENHGTIRTGGLIGIDVYASENAAVVNYGWAEGISVTAQDGTVTIVNDGTSDVFLGWGYSNDAIAIGATADNSDAYVRNDGHVYADSRTGNYSIYDGRATGIYANAGDDTTVINGGLVDVRADGGSGEGIKAVAYDYVSVTNSFSGTVYVRTDYEATGILAVSEYDQAYVHNSGSIDVRSNYSDASGISADGDSVDVFNQAGGTIDVWARDDAYGIDVVGDNGDSRVSNNGSIDVYAEWGDAYGISAYTVDGNMTVDNRGGIDVSADDGGAWGIYVSGYGGILTVGNRGDIQASGWYDASGIEINSYDGSRVTVTNSGSIGASAYEWEAYGIEVDADGSGNVSVLNTATGEVSADSRFDDAFGLYVYHEGSGNVVVRNNGSVDATTHGDGGDAYGIYAYANEGSIIVTNSGHVSASAIDGGEGSYSGDATGIFAETGYGGDVYIRNTGNVSADSWYNDAYGVYVAMDGGAGEIRNSGMISAHADEGTAYGIRSGDVFGGGDAAQWFTLINTGNIYADSTFGDAIGVGLYAGFVSIDTGGVISALATIDGGAAAGVLAEGFYGVDFENSGAIDAQADGGEGGVLGDVADAQGVALMAVDGDVTALNSGEITAYSHSGNAAGLSAVSVFGDVSITSTDTATIDVDGGWFSYGNAVGIEARTLEGGDISVDNAGSIQVRAADRATGVYADATNYGRVQVLNSGEVLVTARDDQAYGVNAFADQGGIQVVNTGVIDVYSEFDDAYGINAENTGVSPGPVGLLGAGPLSPDDGIRIANYGGAIWVDSDYGYAFGVHAGSTFGDVRVGNFDVVDEVTGDVLYGASIDVNGYDGATGILAESRGYSIDYGSDGSHWLGQRNLSSGNVYVYNDQYSSIDVTASEDSNWSGWAEGIIARSVGGSVYVANDGSIDVASQYNGAIGINVEAQGLSASFGINTVGGYYHNYGWEYTAGGDVGVYTGSDSSIDVSANRAATGIRIRAAGGDVTAFAAGDITVGSADGEAYGIQVGAWDTYSNFGRYYAIDGAHNFGHSHYASGDVYVGTGDSANIDVHARYWAAGIQVNAEGGAITVYNGADITVGSLQHGTTGISAWSSGNGDGDYLGGDVYVLSTGDISATTVQYVDGGEGWHTGGTAMGMYIGSAGGDVTVVNRGAIEALSTAYDNVLYARYLAGNASGIEAFSTFSGDVSVGNYGTIVVDAGQAATGIEANAWDNLTLRGQDGYRYLGFQAISGGDVTVVNGEGASISVTSWNYGYAVSDGWAEGISVEAQGGDITVVNDGSIDAESVNRSAAGIYVQADALSFYNGNNWDGVHFHVYDTGAIASGDVYVGTGADSSIDVSANLDASGIRIDARGGDVTVVANGDIDVYSAGGEDWFGNTWGDAYGIRIASYLTSIDHGTDGLHDLGLTNYASGDVSVTTGSSAAIDVRARYEATGIEIMTMGGDITVHNGADIAADSLVFGATGIDVWSLADNNGDFVGGDVSVGNSGDIAATTVHYVEGCWYTGGDAYGIDAFTQGGNITVVNTGGIEAVSTAYDDVLYARFSAIDAYGIIARNSGAGDVSVGNSGTIEALGGQKAVGIWAYAGGSNTVLGWSNPYHDLGRYETAGGDVTVINGEGASIVVASHGPNYDNGWAEGIAAYANGGAIEVINDGSITVDSEHQSAAGIHAEADSLYRDRGSNWVGGLPGYGGTYHDYGWEDTAGGDVTVLTGIGSSIDVSAHHDANGIQIEAYGGDVAVVANGSIEVFSAGGNNGYYGSYTWGDAYGIQVDATATFNDLGGYASPDGWHDLGSVLTASGNVSVTTGSLGSIDVNARFDAAGIDVNARGGDITVHNGADVTVGSLQRNAVGIVAWSDRNYDGDYLGGDVVVTSSGDISATTVQYVEPVFPTVAGGWYTGNDAYGIVAGSEGGDVTVVNTGHIGVASIALDYVTLDLHSAGDAYGIYAEARLAGDVSVGNYGTIEVLAGDEATGITARAWGYVTELGWDGADYLGHFETRGGDVTVINGAEASIGAFAHGNYWDGWAEGIGAYSNGGAITVSNDGSVQAESIYSGATGIWAQTSTLYTDRGFAYIDTYRHEYGRQTTAAGDIGVFTGTDSGIDVRANNDAYGIYIGSAGGDVTVIANGDISAYSAGGEDAWGGNRGDAYGIEVNAWGTYNYLGRYDTADGWNYLGGTHYASGDVSVTTGSSADFTVHARYDAYGIAINADGGDITVHNGADITVGSLKSDAYGIYAWSDRNYGGDYIGGNVVVTNSGDISATTVQYVPTEGWYAAGDAFGIYAGSEGGDVRVVNSGNIEAISTAYDDVAEVRISAGNAFGVYAESHLAGGIEVGNSGTIEAIGGQFASGISTHAQGGNISYGWLTPDHYLGNADTASGDITVINGEGASISAHSYSYNSWNGWAEGISAYANGGAVTIVNDGSIAVDSEHGYAEGIRVQANALDVDNGFRTRGGYYHDYGWREVGGGDVTVLTGLGSTIDVSAFDDASGIEVSAQGGDVTVIANGDISINSTDEDAYGIEIDARSRYSDLGGYATFYGWHDLGGTRYASGDISVTTGGSGVIDVSAYSDAYGISVNTHGGEITVHNGADITVGSLESDAYGIAAWSDRNYNGYYIGADVLVTSSGDISATTVQYVPTEGWYMGDAAYGIYARSEGGDVTVINSGNIEAISTAYDDVAEGRYSAGRAFGIYAESNLTGGIEVGNSGTIEALGGDRTSGISTHATGQTSWYGLDGDHYLGWADTASGDITVINGEGASIVAASYGWGYNGFAEGISAYASGGAVTIVNDGSITVDSENADAQGIRVVANSLDIDHGSNVIDGYDYDYGSQEVAGGDVTVLTGVGSSIDVSAHFDAYGIEVNAEGGDVTVIVQGGIDVHSDYQFAQGISIDAHSTYSEFGGYDTDYGWHDLGATWSASGDVYVAVGSLGAIDVSAQDWAYGIDISTYGGDITVHNLGDITVGSLQKYATGIDARSNRNSDGDYIGGDVTVTNSGDISATTVQYIPVEGWDIGATARGIFAGSEGGNVEVINSGSIEAISTAYDDIAEQRYSANDARGIVAETDLTGDVWVGNSGSIEALGGDQASGISTNAYGWTSFYGHDGDHNLGWAETAGGDITIINGEGGSVAAFAYGDGYSNGWAEGIAAVANGGAITIVNDGSITASSVYASAAGINAFANGVFRDRGGNWIDGYYGHSYYHDYGSQLTAGGDVTVMAGVDSTIDVSANFGATGIGIGADGGDVAVVANGAIDVNSGSGTYNGYTGYATGIGITAWATVNDLGGYQGGYYSPAVDLGTTYYASGDVYVAIGSTGTINVDAVYDAYGVDISARGGDITVHNGGDITVESLSSDAFGIRAESTAYSGDYVDGFVGGDVSVLNSGEVDAAAYYTAYGIRAESDGGDVYVGNTSSGSIFASQDGWDDTAYSYFAAGIEAITTDGNVTVRNAGDVRASGDYNAYGVAAWVYDAGDVSVLNTSTGDIEAEAWSSDAMGISAWADDGNAYVRNNGSLYAASEHGNAYGIYAMAWGTGGDVAVVNTGDITVYAFNEDAYGVYVSGSGDLTVGNAGSITVDAQYWASGIVVDTYGYGGDITVTNTVDGTIDVASYGEGTGGEARGIYAKSATGSISVVNAGSISASGGGDSYGIDAVAHYGGNVVVDNIGIDSVIVVESAGGDATGISADAIEGGVLAFNQGSITVSASADPADEAMAVGITASAGDYYSGSDEWTIGDVGIANSGSIDVQSGYGALGIGASADYGSISILNSASGSIDVAGGAKYSMGIVAFTGEGSIEVINAGDVSVSGDGAFAVFAVAGDTYYSSATYDVRVVNASGASITADGGESGAGVFAFADAGDIGVINAGSIDVTGGYAATGVSLIGQSGDLFAYNTGSVSAISVDGYATGIAATSKYEGAVNVVNLGSIVADGDDTSYGISAVAYHGDVVVNNAAGGMTLMAAGDGGEGSVGTIVVTSGTGDAYGIYAASYDGTVAVYNLDGDVAVTGGGDAYGIHASSDLNDVMVINYHGNVTATAGTGTAIGIQASSGASDAVDVFAYSSGSVTATSAGDAAGGIIAQGDGLGLTRLVNHGVVHVSSHGYSMGLGAYSSYGDAQVLDSGNVVSTATNAAGAIAFGAFAYAGDGAYVGVTAETSIDATATASAGYARSSGAMLAARANDSQIINHGTVRSTATASGFAMAVGVGASSNFGDVLVENFGTIRAVATGADATAVGVEIVGNGAFVLYNSGSITASGSDSSIAILSGGDSADEMINLGTLTGSILVGSGDDSLTNGGTWYALQSSDFGAGDDVIHNGAHGVIWMDNSSISLGDWGSDQSGGGGLQSVTPSGNQFVNDGTIYVAGDSTIDMGAGNANAFTNNGTIDFLDGHPDDVLTIVGDLAGEGDLLVDMSTLNSTSDVLYVDGDVADGTKMHVHGHVDVMPTAATTRIDIIKVSGTSAAGQLVLDSMTVNGDSFVTFQIGVDENINAGNTANDLHSVVIEISGLSSRGDVLSTLAPAMQNYWHESVGSLTRRTGVAEGQELGMPTAWARALSSKQTATPDTGTRNFGAGGKSEFDQSNTGMEFGVDVGLTDNLRLGVLASKGDASVSAKGAGHANIKADSYGAYVTWLGDNGFYVDATYRKMDFTTEVKADGFKDKPDASADGYSLETGYAWKLASGLVLKPELQYSAMTVKQFDVTGNSYGTFDLKDGDSTRLRAGLTVQKTFGEKGKTWTPYGGAYYVNEMDGKGTFDINGDFQGTTDLGGNSVLVEGGVTGQIGNWVLTGGLNWQNGSTISSALGGQLSVRYSF